MEKLNDKEKLFLENLDENKLPKRSGELYRLFDKLAGMIGEYGLHVERPVTRSVEGLSQGEVNMLTKEILTDLCASMIRRLKKHSREN
jgi:hypothetical protein